MGYIPHEMKLKLALFAITGITGLLFAINSSFTEGQLRTYGVDRDFHAGLPLPEGSNTLFYGAGACEMCHGEGDLGPNPDANTDPDGNDISLVTTWQSTMMANSAKDPFWQAKVSHEQLENPDIADDIEAICLKCHAPLGTFNAMHHAVPYSLDSLKTDPIGLDGVSCLACHAMAPDDLGSVFSANMTYDTNGNVYGQYTDPLTMPMNMELDLMPTFGAHISESEACGACHTLITHPVNEMSESLDTFYVEQAIYHEWLNSAYSVEDESCQDCHLPVMPFDVTISNRPPWLDSRSDYARHDMVGGNAFMLRIFADNGDTLGLTASTTDFENTLEKTLQLLENESLSSTLEIESTDDDSVTYAFALENLAGHKLPGGYPSRRLVVEWLVQKQNGDTVFHSGKFNEILGVIGEDEPFEPHYDLIREENEVQIYEVIMADYLGDETTVLKYAHHNLKDNRLVPRGFSTDHYAYDTVRIVGQAETDANFNEDNAGTDIIKLKIPLQEGWEQWVVTGRVHYQTVSPNWLEEMFSYSSDEIDLFRYLYENADLTPVLLTEARINGFSNIKEENVAFTIYPNPARASFRVESSLVMDKILLYDLNGRIIDTLPVNDIQITLSAVLSGTYLVKVVFENQQQYTRIVRVE